MALLFDEVMEVLEAPWWVEQNEALRRVVYHYAQTSELVREVLDGKTTFAAVVRPLVEENRRIKMPLNNAACNSMWFMEMAEAKEARFVGVLSFHSYSDIDERFGMRVSLTARMALPKLKIALFTIVPALLVAGLHALNFYLNPDICGFAMSDFGRCWVGSSIVTLVAALVGFLFSFVPLYEEAVKRKLYANVIMMNAMMLDRVIRDRVK